MLLSEFVYNLKFRTRPFYSIGDAKMGKNGKISEYRERLDRTLASPDLTNDDALKTLLRNQLLRSSPNENEG